VWASRVLGVSLAFRMSRSGEAQLWDYARTLACVARAGHGVQLALVVFVDPLFASMSVLSPLFASMLVLVEVAAGYGAGCWGGGTIGVAPFE
jgi:hypothetical protein